MKPYSNDLRQRIIDAYQNKEGSLREIAKRFSVSLNFVWLLLQRFRKTGRVDPKPHGGGQKRKIERADLIILRQLVEGRPEATLAELRELFCKRTGLKVSDSTIWQTLWRMGFTRQKKTFHATERDEDEEVREARAAYPKEMPERPVEKLKVVDESGVNLGMARRYARAPCGQRAPGDKPGNPGPNITMVGALGIHGLTAIMLLVGSIDGNAFKAFIAQVLVPTLQPGDIVLTDNLTSHKVKGIEEAITAAGAKLQYLPSYSPDFSPIELLWSKLKEALRSTAARTSGALERGIKAALDNITEANARAWFKHCGYCIEPK
jgi:transposase